MIRKICIFGDSIAVGDNDDVFGGWQNRLKIHFAKNGGMNSNRFCHVYNLAVSGRRSDDIIARFKNELLSRTTSKPTKGMLALIALPINDSRYVMTEKGDKKFNITIEQFKENLVKLKELSLKHADETVFVGMTRVDDAKTTPWIVSEHNHCWENEIIKKYNNIAEEFCKKEDVLFLNMFDVLTFEDLPDGLHPNPEGHKKMFEKIKDFLVENKLIR